MSDPFLLYVEEVTGISFSLGDITFTEGLAARAGQGGVFAAGLMLQGALDGTGVPDQVTVPRGTLLGNQTEYFYSNFNPYQGTITFKVTPEWDGDDGIYHLFYDGVDTNGLVVRKQPNNRLYARIFATQFASVDVSGWTAGTTYHLAYSWDLKNTIDGINHGRVSIEGAHTYAMTTAPSADDLYATQAIGFDQSIGGQRSADSLIEELFVFDRVLYDGAYGTDIGHGDEIALIVAGADPCIVAGGSWDATLGMPTDSTPGKKTSGTGQFWSHPRSSNLVDVWGMWDGGLPGTPFAIEYNAVSTSLNCGSDVDIDDIMDAEATVEAWIRADGLGENNVGRIIAKPGTATEGWFFYVGINGLSAWVICNTTDAISYSGVDEFIIDGKWHHVTMYFNDAGDRKIYLAIDGKWVTSYHTQQAGVGAIITDVAESLFIGNDSTEQTTFDGGIAWAAISNNDRHTVGTDFIAPRAFPGDDANYLASWEMDEGTGGAVANTGNQGGAGSGAANRDGTLTNGSWSSIWEQELTPVVPQSVEFFQENDGIDFGSGVNIDDLFTADSTIEFYFRALSVTAGATWVISKCDAGRTRGWFAWLIGSSGLFRFEAIFAGGRVSLTSTFAIDDGIQHHVAIDFDFGTLTGRLLIDGILDDSDAGAGAYQVDAADSCIVNGIGAVGTDDETFAIGWIRLSDSRRYTTTNVVVPGRVNPPGNDANAHLLINMDDGAGVTATDTSGNGYNGTITFGATTRWNNTPDMALDEPGARVKNGGYCIGSDGADDGIKISLAPTNPSDTVMRPIISYGSSGRAWPLINFNGTEYKLPRLHDTHDGAGNSATLINSDGSFVQQLIGWTAYNITDGSSGVITAVSGDKTTITATLSGGTDNDWDAADEYLIRPPNNEPYCKHPIATEALWVLRTAAATVTLELSNEAGEGIIQLHEFQALESLAVNGSMEGVFAGAPSLPPNWLNTNLVAGETAADAVEVHSGAQSIEFVNVVINHRAHQVYTVVVGRFYAAGMWSKRQDGNLTYNRFATDIVAQYDPAVVFAVSNYTGVDAWIHHAGIGRAKDISINMQIGVLQEGTDGNIDDVYFYELDDVSATITPRSEANSLEDGALSVDGHDLASQPISAVAFTPSRGRIQVKVTFKHAAAELVSYGTASDLAYYIHCRLDATRYVQAFAVAANTIRLTFNDGDGAHSVDWNCTSEIAVGDVKLFEVVWVPSWMGLFIDYVEKARISEPVFFTGKMDTVYWGSLNSALSQADAAFGEL